MNENQDKNLKISISSVTLCKKIFLVFSHFLEENRVAFFSSNKECYRELCECGITCSSSTRCQVGDGFESRPNITSYLKISKVVPISA